MILSSLASSPIAVGDPGATRTVYLTTILLVLLGIGLAVLAWWLFLRTRPEPELFAPLEEMETRTWRRLDPDERRRLLDDARPYGARPVSQEGGVGGDEDDSGDDEVLGDDLAVAEDVAVGSDDGSRDQTPTAQPLEPTEPSDSDELAAHDEDASDDHEDDPTVAIDRAASN